MKKIFIVFVLLVICLPVLAANWVEIGYKQYMMIEKVDSSNVYYWIKSLNDGSFKKVDNIVPAYHMLYFVSDCANNQHKNLAFYSYSKTGSVISSIEMPDYFGKTPIPQSNGEYWHQSACHAVSK